MHFICESICLWQDASCPAGGSVAKHMKSRAIRPERGLDTPHDEHIVHVLIIYYKLY